MRRFLFVVKHLLRKSKILDDIIPFLIILYSLFLVQQNIHAKRPIRSSTRPENIPFRNVNEASSRSLKTPHVIWYEDFDNLSNGITMHAGEAGWERDLQGANVTGYFEVRNHKFEAHHVNSEVLWVSEYINIKYYNNVGIAIDLASAGVLESSDSINVYYRIDDGPAIPLQNAQHYDNFNPITATASGLSGEKLQIIAHFRNGDEGEKHSIDNVYVTGESITMPQNLLWYESFTDLADNAAVDNGSSSWSRDISNTSISGVGYFDVHQHRIAGRDLGGEAVWLSEIVDISGQQSVNISADIYGYGLMENNEDYIRVYYKLDEGQETLLTQGQILGTPADWVTAYKNELSGNTLQLIVRTSNDTENEVYRLDNVLIFSNGAKFELTATGGEITCSNSTVALNATASISGVSFSWSGPDNFSSSLQNPAVDIAGTYTVTATSGSTSKTATTEVTENTTIPDISISKSGSLSAMNPDVTLTASSNVSNVSFSWEGFSPGQNPVTVSMAGIYTVVATDNTNGCINSSSVEVKQAPHVIWYEDFDNLSNGITIHAGEAGWERNLQGADISGYFEVCNHKFEAHHVNSEVLWVSEYINIKYYNNVGIAIDLASAGVLESSDSINVYYRIDDGPAIPLQNAQHYDNFNPITATASGLSGEKLQIIAHFRNGDEGEKHSIDNVYVTGESITMPQNLLWYESFTDLADNTAVDNGSSAWSRDISNTSISGVGYFDVHQHRIAGRDLGGEAVWLSEIVDISGQQSVNISADIYGYGLMESNEDYIRVYYKLDGGQEIILTQGEILGKPCDWVTAYRDNLSGNTLQLIVKTSNDTENEVYRLDNILVMFNESEDFSVSAYGGMLNCLNPAIHLNVYSSIDEVEYLWSGPDNFSSAIQNPEVNTPGTYTVTATYGGLSKSATVQVTEDKITPDLIATVSGSLNCEEYSVSILATSSVDVTYNWTGPFDFISTQQNPVTSIPGDYLVKVTSPLNGCMSVDTITVQQNNTVPAEVMATVESTLSCSQNTVTLKGASSSINVSYYWSGPNGYSSSEQNPVVSNPGYYTLLVTDTINKCTSLASVEVKQNKVLPKNVTATVSGILTCNTPTVTLTGASGTVDAIYSWSDSNGNVHNTKTFNTSEPGIYTFKVKDVLSECIDSVNVTVEQDIQIPLGLTASVSDTLSCSITSVLLSALVTTVGAIYSWKGPHNFNSNEQNVVANIPGNYSIEVIDPENGCKAEAQVTVVEEECE